MAGEKILIVEDEADQARMMTLWLEQNGYEVITAHDGVEGLDRALHERPEMIILDLRLPKLPGIQLLQALNSHGFTPPTIIVTAYSSDEIAVQALRLGVRDYLRKPFDLGDLLNAVQRVLEEARLRQERDAFFEELEQRVEELTRLQQVSLHLVQISLETDIKDLYRKLNEQAVTLLDAEMSAI
ncbi:MAG: response regulator, partial [Chloroflexi bacterium]